MAAPAGNWPRLALASLTTVSLEVVTGTRVPPDVTTVKPAVLASDTVPLTTSMPGGGCGCCCAGLAMMTRKAAIVPPELGPATVTDDPSVMWPSSAPDAPPSPTFVAAVVVTGTGWPLAVLMTRLLPCTCSSVPPACSSWVHPVTAVRAVPVPGPDRCTCTYPVTSPTPTSRTSAAAALPATSLARRQG